MNEHYLFGHFAQAELALPRFGQFLGHPKFSLWTRFLHQNCGIIYLVSPPIGLSPMGAKQVQLRLSKHTGL